MTSPLEFLNKTCLSFQKIDVIDDNHVLEDISDTDQNIDPVHFLFRC